MKKQDLKPGMVVEVRGGKKYLISAEKFKFIDLEDGCHFNPLDGYDDDLLFRNDGIIICLVGSGENNSDIVKVYSDYTCSNLLWERKVKPSLTADESILLELLKEAGYRYIARDEDTALWAFNDEPTKHCDGDGDDYWACEAKQHAKSFTFEYTCYQEMFKFIKWGDEKPYSIIELLKGETK